MVFLLPSHVCLVAEGAYHYGSCAVPGIHFVVGYYASFLAEDRHSNGLSHNRLVLVIFWMDCNSYAGGKKVGSGGRNLHSLARSTEPHVVQRTFPFLVHNFCFCYRCFVAGTPVHRMFRADSSIFSFWRCNPR